MDRYLFDIKSATCVRVLGFGVFLNIFALLQQFKYYIKIIIGGFMNFENVINGEILNSPVPWGKDEAVRLGYKKYTIDEKCLECKSYPVSKYVENDVCVMCSIPAAYETWKLWTMGSPDRPDPFPRNKDDAKSMGLNFYYEPIVCKNGMHFRQPHITTGRCQECANSKNPRLLAKHHGLTTYKPDHPCQNCGELSRRKVATNECLNCDNKVNSSKLMFENPNAIITRDCAEMLGLSVYRTGEPCKKGHKGWRYRSTGGCISCLKGESIPKPPDADTLPIITINQQLSMFIGYSYSGRKFQGSDGKRWNKLQFDSMFPVMAMYETKLGVIRNPSDAFIANFVDNDD